MLRHQHGLIAGHRRWRVSKSVVVAATIQVFVGSMSVWAQGNPPSRDAKLRLEISGHPTLDTGFEVGQSDPNWCDVVRPSKLPSFKDEFGKDGRWFAGVRQSRM